MFSENEAFVTTGSNDGVTKIIMTTGHVSG